MSRISKFIRKPKIRLSKPRFKLPKAPSKTFWYVLSLFIIYFCLAGGVYDIVKQPISVGVGHSGNPVVFFTSSLGGGIDKQFIVEGLIGSLLMFLGFLGFLAIYESSKHIYMPNYAYALLISGVIMVFAAFAGLQGLMAIKIS